MFNAYYLQKINASLVPREYLSNNFKSGGQTGHSFQGRSNKVLQRKKNISPPNEWRNIPSYNSLHISARLKATLSAKTQMPAMFHDITRKIHFTRGTQKSIKKLLKFLLPTALQFVFKIFA